MKRTLLAWFVDAEARSFLRLTCKAMAGHDLTVAFFGYST
jgi:hypothetical protein